MPVNTVLRLPDDIAAKLREESAKLSISMNTVILRVLADRYGLELDESATRKPKRPRKKT